MRRFHHQGPQEGDRASSGRIPASQPITPAERSYLPDAAYLLPKDEEEANRLDFQHYALFHALGAHYLAPLPLSPKHMLDVGTGTGKWAREMARRFPQTQVVGIDLSATSFRGPSLPNCLLQEGNVLAGLPFADGSFEYVHQRLLGAALTAHQWPAAIREIVRLTSAGGWIELVEFDEQMEHVGSATASVRALVQELSQSRGIDGRVIRRLPDLLRQQRVESLTHQEIPLPVGEWHGRTGRLLKQDLLVVMQALRERVCQQAGILPPLFDHLVAEMGQEWERLHAHCIVHVIYGQRGEGENACAVCLSEISGSVMALYDRHHSVVPGASTLPGHSYQPGSDTQRIRCQETPPGAGKKDG